MKEPTFIIYHFQNVSYNDIMTYKGKESKFLSE